MKTKYFSTIMLSALLCACADNYESGSTYEKPSAAEQDEYLASFQTLKSYVDTIKNPAFGLGMNISSSNLLAKGTMLSLGKSNFTAIEITDGLNHSALVGDGSVTKSNAQTLIETANNFGMNIHGSAIVASYGLNYGYLNGLIAPDTIKGETTAANVLMYDFESLALGTEFKMTGVSTATVEEDPDGESGHVLHVGNATTQAKNSFPILDITLPEGITLGDCATLIMDMRVGNSTGRYGSGMRMGVNDNKLSNYGNPSSMGCPNDAWGRGCITLDFSAMSLTDEEKALNSFSLTVGSATGSGNYYIDNVYIRWEHHTEDQIFIKTADEKKQIITSAMTDYVKGLMAANAGIVSDWDIVSQPTSDVYWQDYLGIDYVKIASDTISKYYIEYGGDASKLRFFVDETNLFEPGSNKVTKLNELISQWENDGKKRISGISAQLPAYYSLDANQQAINEQTIEATLKNLAATGKLIRLSNFSIRIVNTDGEEISSSEITEQIQDDLSDYYKFILSKYFDIIPQTQRAGVFWANPVGKAALWDTDFNRQIPYVGCCEGLGNR